MQLGSMPLSSHTNFCPSNCVYVGEQNHVIAAQGYIHHPGMQDMSYHQDGDMQAWCWRSHDTQDV